jgi:hypothetical protein
MQVQSKDENCVHHWIIDEAVSAYSVGKCARCGLEKKFINDWDELMAISGKNAKTQNRVECLQQITS